MGVPYRKPQDAFGARYYKRFPVVSGELPSEEVEVLGGGRGEDHVHVDVGLALVRGIPVVRELKHALQTRRRVLGARSVQTMRQKQHDSTLL
jgi:hypothetical protein